MKVVGAFVEDGSEEFIRWATSEVGDFDLVGVGSNADAVIHLCKQHQPDVILVGSKFMPEVQTLRTFLASTDLGEVLLIGIVPPVGEYPRAAMREAGVPSEIRIPDFTDSGWHAAVATARRARSSSDRILIVPMFPSTLPYSWLSSIFAPWPEFEIASNCSSSDELLHALTAQHTKIVALHPCYIDTIPEVRQALVAQDLSEPHWVLMMSHVDTSTLVQAAFAGITHMFSSDEYEPAERFVEQMRDCANGKVRGDTPLSHTHRQLQIAVDDDDRRILQLLVTGDTNHEIADKVFFAEQTVKNRISRLMKAAGVSNRTELAMLFATSASGISKGAGTPQ